MEGARASKLTATHNMVFIPSHVFASRWSRMLSSCAIARFTHLLLLRSLAVFYLSSLSASNVAFIANLCLSSSLPSFAFHSIASFVFLIILDFAQAEKPSTPTQRQTEYMQSYQFSHCMLSVARPYIDLRKTLQRALAAFSARMYT